MTLDQFDPSPPLEPEGGKRMTHAEAVLLCRYAKAACPQQQFDAYTPDAWCDLLEDLRFDDAKLALQTLVKRQPFVSPAEIRDEVKRIRGRRIGEFGPIPDPPFEPMGPEYQRWHTEMLRRIGDGELRRGDLPEPELTEPRNDGDRKSLKDLADMYRDQDRGDADGD